MAIATFRHFCSSSRVLDLYETSSLLFLNPTSLCKTIYEAVSLSLRTENVSIPDHQHRNRVCSAFNEKKRLVDMLLIALGAVDDSHDSHCLEIDHGRLYIRTERLEDWQREVAAYQSPVPIMAAFWVRHCRENVYSEDYAIKHLYDALSASTLPGINDSRLNNLIQSDERGNLCDLHLHLNGSSEFTQVWLDSLLHPEQTYIEIIKALKSNEKRVGFFLKQLRVDPMRILHRLRTASEVRKQLCLFLKSFNSNPITNPIPVIAKLLKGNKEYSQLEPCHPFRHPAIRNDANETQREGCMWVHAIWLLQTTRNHTLAILMHIYLLLMHQHLRLLVHQPEQYGFDQFQYITMNGAREASEHPFNRGFSERFRQFYGMYGQDMKYVEARFSPKANPSDTMKLIEAIWKGYRKATCDSKKDKLLYDKYCCLGNYPSAIEYDNVHMRLSSPPKYSLGLVAHFIKKPDQVYNEFRHQTLRDDLLVRANALVAVRKSLQYNNKDLYEVLVGKDAASNELDTPPEVFGPVFRYLTREGIRYTTYHAGEDFVHILCGIRAVHEAISFLGLRNGDRIGHATALGLDPIYGIKTAISCPQGQWLDNLIWLSRMIHQCPCLRSFNGELSQIETRIACLHSDIYSGINVPSLPILWAAWELRAYDPRQLYGEHSCIHPFSRMEYNAILHDRSKFGEQIYKAACKEVQLYHRKRCQWNKVITIQPDDFPSIDLLRALQDEVIKEMRMKNIIVEVPPTSNIRISRYVETTEHHLMRWLDPNNTRPSPQVVLGTDDPGIFSTSLRNEYSFILKKFKELYPGSSEKPYELIHHLIENGSSYSFLKNKMH